MHAHVESPVVDFHGFINESTFYIAGVGAKLTPSSVSFLQGEAMSHYEKLK